MKMIKGEYDINPGVKKMFPLFGWGIIVAVLVFRFAFHWSWVVSILAGIIAGIIAEQVIAVLIRSIPGKKSLKK